MLRGGDLLRVIVLIMGEVRPFTNKQIKEAAALVERVCGRS
jgi:hypothetical protein